MSTRQRVIQIVADVIEAPESEVRPDSHFLNDLGMTSLEIVNLIWRVESEFSLGETPESVLEGLATVSQLVEFVDSMRNEESEVIESANGAVIIASDHAGIGLKAHLVEWLKARGWDPVDLGPSDSTAVDYPSFAGNLARKVARGDFHAGVLICGSGIGMSIAANKVPGIRAALVSEPLSASMSRKHNNANVLCLGARMVGPDLAAACLQGFLETEFEPGDDGRHQRRVNMISDLEHG